jgi:hypothetical protein
LRGLVQEGDLATANHPFFWAGYLLVDTGPPTVVADEEAEAEQASEAPTGTKAAPVPPPVPPQGNAAPPAENSASETPTQKTPLSGADN